MSTNNDQVFPTSLSEVAFTLVFLLMLLLGYMIVRVEKEKAELKVKLLNATQTESAEAAKNALDKAIGRFESEMAAAGHPSPEAITTKIVETSDVQVARDRLRKEQLDLNERMSALNVLWEKVERAGIVPSDKVRREEIEQALRLQEEIRTLAVGQWGPAKPVDAKQALERVKNAIAATKTLYEEAKAKLGIEIRSGEEPATVRDVIEGAQRAAASAGDRYAPGILKAENQKLRGQIQYLSNQGLLRGLDHPPCWTDGNGKIEYLFTVETRPDGFITTKAWPANREKDARLLPNIDQALVAGPTKPGTFSSTMQPILDWSKSQDPECRHFVYLTTTVADGDARDKVRKTVESFFYKLEVKR